MSAERRVASPSGTGGTAREYPYVCAVHNETVYAGGCPVCRRESVGAGEPFAVPVERGPSGTGGTATVFVNPLMLVEAPQLLAAADELGNDRSGTLRNGVVVTAAQLRKAGEILRDGPQPIANGIKSNMPGFIDREQQPRNGALVFNVGILPSKTYRITKRGTAREVDSHAC